MDWVVMTMEVVLGPRSDNSVQTMRSTPMECRRREMKSVMVCPLICCCGYVYMCVCVCE